MRVTLDSGILVRGSASPGGSAAALIKERVPPEHRMLLSEFILDEFRRVMSYPRIQRRGITDDLHMLVTGGPWAVGVGLEESEHDILDGIAWSVAERA